MATCGYITVKLFSLNAAQNNFQMISAADWAFSFVWILWMLLIHCWYTVHGLNGLLLRWEVVHWLLRWSRKAGDKVTTEIAHRCTVVSVYSLFVVRSYSLSPCLLYICVWQWFFFLLILSVYNSVTISILSEWVFLNFFYKFLWFRD